MAIKGNKSDVRAYIDHTLNEKLEAYAHEKGLSKSSAIEDILSHFFSPEQDKSPDTDRLLSILRSEMKAMIEQEVKKPVA